MKSLVPVGCSKREIYLLTTCARQRVKKVNRSASSNLNTLKDTCSQQAISWMITHKQICAFAFLASVSAYVTEITFSKMWLELPKIQQSIRNINWIVFMQVILQVIYTLDKRPGNEIMNYSGLTHNVPHNFQNLFHTKCPPCWLWLPPQQSTNRCMNLINSIKRTKNNNIPSQRRSASGHGYYSILSVER